MPPCTNLYTKSCLSCLHGSRETRDGGSNRSQSPIPLGERRIWCSRHKSLDAVVDFQVLEEALQVAKMEDCAMAGGTVC